MLSCVFPDVIQMCKKLNVPRIMTTVSCIRDKEGDIHSSLGFRRTIFMDCGIFQHYKDRLTSEEIQNYREKLVTWYSCLKPDLASALDIPSLLWHDLSTKKERMTWSIENYLYMKKRVPNKVLLVPGVCAFSQKSVDITSRHMARIGELSILGIGGCVPLIKLSAVKPEFGKIVVKLVHAFRSYFPGTHLHVYGAGSHRWYMLVRFLGADSADCSSYIQMATKGHIILPGIGARHIAPSKLYKKADHEVLKNPEMKILGKCSCPSCKHSDIMALAYDKSHRLMHNLFVTASEAKLVDEFCERNDDYAMAHFIKGRLVDNNSHLKNVAEEALKIKGF